jgi:ubiquitin C-terminal hydrolase
MLPDILVVHLKRFSYSRYLKNKLDTFVNFPIRNLDLSKYVKSKDGRSHMYELYAISNHYGGLGGGHYTAYAKVKDLVLTIQFFFFYMLNLKWEIPSEMRSQILLMIFDMMRYWFLCLDFCLVQLIDENRWYHFDDSHVSPVNEAEIRTSAAYLLFYQRVKTESRSEAGETSRAHMDF